MSTKDVIAKREIEIKVLKDQIAGVEKKLKNLTATRDNLQKGLARAEESRKKLLEIAKDENP